MHAKFLHFTIVKLAGHAVLIAAHPTLHGALTFRGSKPSAQPIKDEARPSMSGKAPSQAAQRALEEIFVSILPRLVAHARESSVPSQGLTPFSLLMYIAALRAAGVTVTRAELARRLDKSNQMFAKHVDTLVSFGMLSMLKVTGGHGIGTQWQLELVNPCIVDALQPLAKRLDGATVGVVDGLNIAPALAKKAGVSAKLIDRAPPGHRRGPRPSP